MVSLIDSQSQEVIRKNRSPIIWFLGCVIAVVLVVAGFAIYKFYTQRAELQKTNQELRQAQLLVVEKSKENDRAVVADNFDENKKTIGEWEFVETRAVNHKFIWTQKIASEAGAYEPISLAIVPSISDVIFAPTSYPDIYAVQVYEAGGEVDHNRYIYFNAFNRQILKVSYMNAARDGLSVFIREQTYIVEPTASAASTTDAYTEYAISGIKVNGREKYMLNKPLLQRDENCDGICVSGNIILYEGISSDFKQVYFGMLGNKYVFDVEKNIIQLIKDFPSLVKIN